jgi:hypothetical protein
MRLSNLSVSVLLGAAVLAGCADDATDADEAAQVKVSSCVADPAGGKPRAEGTIVNSTTKPSGYTFRVRFLDPAGNEVSQATNAVARVEQGATATWRVQGGESASGALSCEIDQVTRTAVGT